MVPKPLGLHQRQVRPRLGNQPDGLGLHLQANRGGAIVSEEEKLKLFERATDAGAGLCSFTCECGKHYYRTDDDIDWTADELEKLEKEGHGLPHSIGVIRFEGKQYVSDCDCWHERASQIIGFLESHHNEIATFLKLLKAAKIAEIQNIADPE